jgi:hypothetical protein
MQVSTELSTAGPPKVVRSRIRKRGERPSRSDRVRLITLRHLDGRTFAASRASQLIMTLEREYSVSDTASVSEGVRQLCQRGAVLGAILEDFEARWISGEAVDLPSYLATVATQRRVLQALGLQRQGPRDVTPSLGSYLDGKADKQADAGDSEGSSP